MKTLNTELEFMEVREIETQSFSGFSSASRYSLSPQSNCYVTNWGARIINILNMAAVRWS